MGIFDFFKRKKLMKETAKYQERHRIQVELIIQKEQEFERLRQEQIEIHKKQDEERNRQEQLKIQKRQEEERVIQEQIEIKKRQELTIYQAEIEAKRRIIDAERRKQEKIELEKVQEEELRRQEQFRDEKIRTVELSGGFKTNLTSLYHNIYGEGVFVEFDSTKKYIHIRFKNEEKIMVFVYPDAIEKYLFIQKTEKLIMREDFLKTPKNEKEDAEEQRYFIKVCDVADKSANSFNKEVSNIKFGYNDFSDSFDSTIHYQFQYAYDNVELWRNIRKNPYFARVDYGEINKIYIGKNSIDGLVVDWRDKRCNLYYQYNIYIGNEEYKLSLVRDFDIVGGFYCGFNDKYSINGVYENDKLENSLISDEFLLKVLRLNRSDKNTHDIIQTIQRYQYEIITYEESESMLILGCAGSGKTMIMLHRLSHLIFNNRDLDIKSVYLISPTRLLNLENDELSKTLNINSANRLAIGLFNANLTKQYYEQNDAFNRLEFHKIATNSVIDENFIKFVYSDGFVKSFKEDIVSIILSNSEKRAKFIEIEREKLIHEYGLFCEDGIVISSIDDTLVKNEALNDIYENVKYVISKVPLENAIEKSKNLTISMNLKNTKDKTLKGKKEVLENLISYWDLSEKTIYKEKTNDISVADEIFSEVFAYFDVLGTKNKQNKRILNSFHYLSNRYCTALQLLYKYKEIVEKISRFERFVKGRDYDYLSEIIGRLIVDIKIKNQIDINYTYEFEVFLHLIGCNVIFGKLHDKHTLLFIDEFQDYAATELTLYKQVFPNSVFNLFGDINQSINPKGLNVEEVNHKFYEYFKSFEIKENYRNAHQVTEFINSEFNMSMTPIGIEGSVKQIDAINFCFEIKLEESDRIAFIVKNIALYENLMLKYSLNTSEEINVIIDDECEIKRGILNVIPISLAKGLEFEQVYVVLNQMTQNEKYVAYTRTLNNLYVLKME